MRFFFDRLFFGFEPLPFFLASFFGRFRSFFGRFGRFFFVFGGLPLVVFGFESRHDPAQRPSGRTRFGGARAFRRFEFFVGRAAAAQRGA